MDFLFGGKKHEVPHGDTPHLHTPVGFLPETSMYLMAALQEGEKFYEVELAALHGLDNGGLEIRPGIWDEYVV